MMRTLLHGLLILSVSFTFVASLFSMPPLPASSSSELLPLAQVDRMGAGTEALAPQRNSDIPQIGAPPQSPYISLKLKDSQDLLGLQQLNTLMGTSLLRRNSLTGVDTLHVPSHLSPNDIAQRLMQDPRIEWAEAVKWRRLSDPPRAPLTPNDPFFTDNQRWYYNVISAPDAWGIETGKSSVTIAVIDSGVMCSHPDLSANMWVNTREIPNNGKDDDGNSYIDDVNGYDFVGAETGLNEVELDLPGDGDPCVKAGDPSDGNGLDDDNNGQADDGVTHGTFVAGVAAATSNNGVGVTGMCWGCRIMAVRVANPEGWVRSNDTADGIAYAAKNGAKVINMSLGGPEISQAETDAVNLAVNTFGATIVAATGNENRHPLDYPARLANVLAVGASAHANTKGRASFSNWGTGGVDDRLVDVVAPGVDIASSSILSVADQTAGGGQAGSAVYKTGAGTSFSAPLVAGLAGLMLSVKPSLSNAQVRSIIKDTAMPLGDDPSDNPNAGPGWAGSGLINALAALNAAIQVATPSPTPTATATRTATPGTGSPTPTATPLAAGSPPLLLSPATGATLQGLGATLTWSIPAGATQYHIQVVPANNDGPAINLIRNIDTSYNLEQPVFGTGPYVMLPGMTYTWRVQTTTATTGIDENSPLWGTWSANFTFRTRTASSAGITAVAPTSGSNVMTRTPVLQWNNTDFNVFYYEVQVSKDRTFNNDPATATAMVYYVLIHGGVSSSPNSYAIPPTFPLEPNTTYFWRVRPRIQGDGTPVSWSSTFSLNTR